MRAPATPPRRERRLTELRRRSRLARHAVGSPATPGRGVGPAEEQPVGEVGDADDATTRTLPSIPGSGTSGSGNDWTPSALIETGRKNPVESRPIAAARTTPAATLSPTARSGCETPAGKRRTRTAGRRGCCSTGGRPIRRPRSASRTAAPINGMRFAPASNHFAHGDASDQPAHTASAPYCTSSPIDDAFVAGDIAPVRRTSSDAG